MRSRVFGIKKSLLLKTFAVFLFLLFAISTFFSIYSLKLPSLWFYNFCICVGFFQLAKGFLFNFDSTLYIGFLLTFVGAVGVIFSLTQTANFAIFYILIALSTASVFTFIYAGQKFHLIFAYSLIFVNIFSFLLVKKFITLPIFIAFISLFLVLLVVGIFCNKKWR